MIEVQPFLDKLDRLREYMEYYVESKDFDNRVWWEIYDETGVAIYRKNYHKTFEQWLETLTHKQFQSTK